MDNETERLAGNNKSEIINVQRIFSLFLGLNLATLVLTVIPVVTSLPSLRSDGWYTGDDIIRLAEPLITLPLSFLILWEAPLIHRPNAHFRPGTSLLAFFDLQLM